MSSPASSRAAAAFSRSSTSRMRSASSGTSVAKSMASTTSMGLGTETILLLDRRGLGPLGLPHDGGLAFDDDIAEELGLLRADLALAAELEDREETDDDLRALALAAGHRAEEQRPGVTQQREDLGHALQHRGRVRLHLPRPQALL